MRPLDLLSRQPNDQARPDDSLLTEERELRAKVISGIAKLAVQYDNGTGDVPSSGFQTIRLPVVIWIGYQLSRNLRRLVKLKQIAEVRGLKRRPTAGPTVDVKVVHGILSTGALRLFVGDVLEDLVREVWGADSLLMETSSNPPPAYDASSTSDASPPLYASLAPQSKDALNNKDWLTQTLSLLEDALLVEDGSNSKSMSDEPPAGFEQLVQDLLNGAPTDGEKGILRTDYTLYCDWCSQLLKDRWYSCVSCVEYDLCSECFRHNKPKHPHGFDEIVLSNVSDEIEALRRLVESIKSRDARMANVQRPTEKTRCKACSRKTSNGIYYACFTCDDYIICRDCLVLPTTRLGHSKHSFLPIKGDSDTSEDNENKAISLPQYSTPPNRRSVCNYCGRFIEEEKWLTCMEPSCYDNVDLHPSCANWSGDGAHKDTHPLEYVHSA